MRFYKISKFSNLALVVLTVIAVAVFFFSEPDVSGGLKEEYISQKLPERSVSAPENLSRSDGGIIEISQEDSENISDTANSSTAKFGRGGAAKKNIADSKKNMGEAKENVGETSVEPAGKISEKNIIPVIADQSFGDSTPTAKSSDASSQSSPSLIERIVTLPSAVKSAVEFKITGFKPSPEITVPIRGQVRVEIIDQSTICVVGWYHRFLRERFAAECGSFLSGIDSPAANLKSWSRNVFYNCLGADIILKYRPTIAKAYQGKFEISDGVKIKDSGYWLSPIGQARFTEVRTGEDKLTYNAEVAHYAFLKLESPLKDGVEYSLKNELGETVKFKYEAEKNLSGAIKINQLGYSQQASQKYAYVGAWLGALGALDMSSLRGKNFEIKNASDNSSAYVGTLEPRGREVFYKSGAPFTGEDVLQADFSKFNQEGKYYIYIEGVGRSHDFEISNNAIGEAFYVHCKGLYHKRCGIAKESPFTNWHMGKCHMLTYQSDFPPNNNHYNVSKKEKEFGFFDENGNVVEVSHFKLIKLLENDVVVKGVSGGWHDAADYDRRPYHFDVVCDLLAAYLYKPENFADNQLNIPESGNGIPDIIDEAVWGMEVWRKAQKDNGSVGTWIEASSHPKDYNPATDTQHYNLSAATRESTMQYSAHASMLALALKNAGADALANTYLESAKRAYDFASKPENRFIKSYLYPSHENPQRRITYRESKEVPAEYVFKAAFNLWLLTKNDAYLDAIDAVARQLPRKFIEMSWKINPFFFAEFLKYGRGVPVLGKVYAELQKRTMMFADERIKMLDNYPYRIPWHSPSHPYVTYMSWGAYHPLRNAKYFVNAYEITGAQKYRDAAYLCNDFHNGANANGQTMTSGLGYNYPAQFLDLPSYSDGIDEFILGITPYRNTFGIGREDIKLAHGLLYKPRADRKFFPKPTMVMPPSIIGNNPDISEKQLLESVGKAWPIWRRFANVEAYTVAASEYTVSETIAPAAAVSGWLLSPSWKPSDKIKNRKPVADRSTLEGFAPLP